MTDDTDDRTTVDERLLQLLVSYLLSEDDTDAESDQPDEPAPLINHPSPDAVLGDAAPTAEPDEQPRPNQQESATTADDAADGHETGDDETPAVQHTADTADTDTSRPSQREETADSPADNTDDTDDTDNTDDIESPSPSRYPVTTDPADVAPAVPSSPADRTVTDPDAADPLNGRIIDFSVLDEPLNAELTASPTAASEPAPTAGDSLSPAEPLAVSRASPSTVEDILRLPRDIRRLLPDSTGVGRVTTRLSTLSDTGALSALQRGESSDESGSDTEATPPSQQLSDATVEQIRDMLGADTDSIADSAIEARLDDTQIEEVQALLTGDTGDGTDEAAPDPSESGESREFTDAQIETLQDSLADDAADTAAAEPDATRETVSEDVVDASFWESASVQTERVRSRLSDQLTGTDDDAENPAVTDAPSEASYSFSQSKYRLFFDSLAYGIFGRFFRGKTDKYAQFDRKLNQARIPISFDIYLSRVMGYASSVATAGAALALVTSYYFAASLVAVESSVQVPAEIGRLLAEYKFALAAGSITGAVGVVLFAVTAGVLYYRPFYVAGERKRKIDAGLPHAATFMYAMSRGGVNVADVIRAVSDTEDSYGQIANEFRAITNNIQYAQKDLRTAVLEEAQETPSENLNEFLEDLLTVVDSGADMEQFFMNKSELYLERAKNQQRQSLQTLEVLAESYVTVFVAAPIFALIIFVVTSLLGSSRLPVLYAMTYFGIPMGAVLFTMLIRIISATENDGLSVIPSQNLPAEYLPQSIDDQAVRDDPRYATYSWYETLKSLKTGALTPFSLMREQPPVSAILTVPLSVLFGYYLIQSGLATLSVAAFLSAPYWHTLTLVYMPIVVVFGTLSLLHELKMRRRGQILQRIPEVFKNAADANSRGLNIEGSLDIVATNTDGALSDDLRHAVNETSWTGNLNDSLIKFANSVKVPRLTRTIKLITKANEVTGDVSAVLDVAARDVDNMEKLDTQRKQNAYQHLFVIMISFFVSLGVIVAIDSYFLAEISGTALAGGDANSISGVSGGGSTGGVPFDKFSLIFLHTVMILGGASGVVTGAITHNDPLRGVKYSLFTMGLTLAVFAFF